MEFERYRTSRPVDAAQLELQSHRELKLEQGEAIPIALLQHRCPKVSGFNAVARHLGFLPMSSVQAALAEDEKPAIPKGELAISVITLFLLRTVTIPT